MWELSESALDVETEGWGLVQACESLEMVEVFLGDLTLFDEVGKSDLEHMLSVELPDSSEVGLTWDGWLHLVWIDDVFFSNKLWGHLSKSVPFLFELSFTLCGGGVNTENEFLFLISMGEWVMFSFNVVHMTTISEPGWFGDFIVEKSWRRSLTPLLESEPFDDVWLLSFTSELGWSPLWVQVMESIFPSLSWVCVKFPTVSLLSGGPIWNLETLEESSWSSVEVNISYSLEEGIWVEILSINVELNVWFFVELIHIEVFNSNTYIILNWKSRYRQHN